MEFDILDINKFVTLVCKPSAIKSYASIIRKVAMDKSFRETYGKVILRRKLYSIGSSAFFSDILTSKHFRIYFGAFYGNKVYLSTSGFSDVIYPYDSFIIIVNGRLICIDYKLMEHMITSFYYRDEIVYDKGFAEIDVDTFEYEYDSWLDFISA